MHGRLLGPVGLSLVLGILSVTTISLTGCAKKSAEATATTRDITAYVVAKGSVYAPANARADVFSPYQAAVDRVLVTVGANVRRGETLILLSAPQNQAFYEQARATLRQAQANYEQARSQYAAGVKSAQQALAASRSTERSTRAAAQQPAPQPANGGVYVAPVPDVGSATMERQADEQAVIDAQAQMAEGLVPYQQAVASAQEQFAAAQAGHKAAQLKSPISGTVLAINTSPGVVPDPEDKKPLVTVVNLEALKVAAGIKEEQLPLLRPDYPAVVTIKEVPNVEFEGALDDIYTEKAGFLRGEKYMVLVDFKNRKGEAKPDMEATASIKVGQVKAVVAVPANAVMKLDNNQFGVKVKENGQWVQRVVEVGLSDGQYTQIKSGVKEGDVVMTNP